MGIKRRIPIEIAHRDMTLVGLNPIGNFPGTHKSWSAVCNICSKHTQIVFGSVRKRIAKNPVNPTQGCETCVFASMGKSRLLEQVEVEKRLAALGMRVTGIYLGAFEPVTAICLTCGIESDVFPSHAFSKGHACSKCSLKRRSDLSRKPQEQAVSEMLQNGYKPLDPYVTTNAKWRSIHLECGNEVSPSLGHVKRGQGGCSNCAKFGFDSTMPAIFYVLSNKKFNAIKVGITGAKSTRLRSLNVRHGWEVQKEFKFNVGHEARLVEKIVLAWWRTDLNAPIALSPSDTGRLGGWTETSSLALVSVEDTLAFISSIHLVNI
jgi:hypothetical protein